MFEQYLRIKEGYPDALLFYRMGDFYELFFEDAEVASRELQIALTSRNPNAESPIPMCGVPWHAAEGYVSQLLNKGYKIAFCDQVEDPRAARGLVERAVTRVYTPGTAVEDVSLEPKGHTYLGALFWSADTDRGGFAWVDVSTGYWAGLHVKKSQELWQWAQKIAPRELLLPEDADVPASLHLTDIQAVRVPLRSHFDYKRSAERVLAAQSVAELGALGLEDRKELVQACGALLAYLEQTQMQDTKHLAPFEPLDLGQHLLIDDVTERNLELFRRLDGRKGVGTLRHVLDSTQTPMGGRLLEERLRNPWRELAPIQETQDAIAWLVAHPENRKKLRETLSGVYDLERLSTRIALNRTSPRDMLSLRQSLAALPPVKSAITSSDADTPRVLRQTALICLLAQMGSFVPAREAQLGLCDRIFSRVGASDNLAQGQSTFMVEMMETARILRQATKRSLVILDEIGRGTSTFDGLALAWAVAEELARRAGGSIRTLFATHYHELTALEGKIPGVHTMNIAIREWNGEIVFLRRLIPGPSDRSYGIEVARLAGVPQPVVQRAREILAQLEHNKGSSPVRQVMPNLLPGIQLPEAKPKKAVEEVAAAEPEHPLLVALRDTNPDALTPLEALKRITEWKLLWGAPKQ